MRQANRAVIRERLPIPTVKELLYNLNGAKYFSKVDLTQAFHQFELDEASRDITTFVTPFGLFKYKCLMFGIASNPDQIVSDPECDFRSGRVVRITPTTLSTVAA